MEERLIGANRLKEVLERNFGHTGGVSALAQLNYLNSVLSLSTIHLMVTFIIKQNATMTVDWFDKFVQESVVGVILMIKVK